MLAGTTKMRVVGKHVHAEMLAKRCLAMVWVIHSDKLNLEFSNHTGKLHHLTVQIARSAK